MCNNFILLELNLSPNTPSLKSLQIIEVVLYSSYLLLTIGMTAGGESDIGSVDGMMPEEVEAAFQVIIEDQDNSI